MLFKNFTPYIWSVLFPIHFILPPAEFKKLIKSFISGSIAQFFNILLPLARVDAIIRFSLAPTETLENLIFPPTNPLLAVA